MTGQDSLTRTLTLEIIITIGMWCDDNMVIINCHVRSIVLTIFIIWSLFLGKQLSHQNKFPSSPP